jgi:hypothetical protein
MLFGIFLIPSFVYYYEDYKLKYNNSAYGYQNELNNYLIYNYVGYLGGSILYVITVASLISIGITLTLATVRKKVKLTIGFNERNAEFNNDLCLSIRIRI